MPLQRHNVSVLMELNAKFHEKLYNDVIRTVSTAKKATISILNLLLVVDTVINHAFILVLGLLQVVGTEINKN